MKTKPRIHSVDTFANDYWKAHADEVMLSTKTIDNYSHQGLLVVNPLDCSRAIRLRPRTKKRPSTNRQFRTLKASEIGSILGLKTVGKAY